MMLAETCTTGRLAPQADAGHWVLAISRLGKVVPGRVGPLQIFLYACSLLRH